MALNVFISEISKENFNNEELKQGHVEPIKEETQSINLGADDEPKMVQIGNTLTSSEKDALVTPLKEFREVFAWSYKDMPRDWYRYSTTLHSYRPHHEANQAEAEKDEAKVDS